MNVLDLARKHCEPKKAASTKGGEYHSPCPGCGGEDRFHVWPEENDGEGGYWCRQCGKAGDGIQFLRDFEGLSFQEACGRLGKDVPELPSQGRGPRVNEAKKTQRPWEPDPPDGPPVELWQEKAGALVEGAFNNLMRDQAQLAWLAKRGINEFTAKHFRLGWIPEDLFRPRASWGLPPEHKDDGKEKRLWIPKGLVIPLRKAKEVWRVRIRRPEGVPPYYVLPGSNMGCMLRQQDHRAYVVVESELDAVLLDQEASDLAGIVALGNSSRKPDAEISYFLRNAAVILDALDYDDPGARAGQWWQEHFAQTRRWPVPEGKDPGEAYKAGVDLREWVKAGLPGGWFL